MTDRAEQVAADPFSLRYFGPDRHADWCDGDPTHEGFCLDMFIRSVKEADRG